MIILAMECSSATGSVTLVSDDSLIWEEFFSSPRGRGTQLFQVLERALAIETPERIVVGTGPGSYNGLRSAAAAAWGIARARSIPCVGACSLLGYEPQNYGVLGDARSGQWFHARVKQGKLESSPGLMPAGEWPFEKDLPVFSPTGVEGAIAQAPSARWLARYHNEGGAVEPIYLKPPHITRPAGH